MMNRKGVAKLAVGIWLATVAAANAELPRLLSYRAKNHLGENATVCGVVASTKYLESKRRSPILLDLDRAYRGPAVHDRHLGAMSGPNSETPKSATRTHACE